MGKSALQRWRQDASFKIEHNRVRRGSRPDYGRSRSVERTDRELDEMAHALVSLLADGRDDEFIARAADVAVDPSESVLLMSRLATAASWFAGIWADEDAFADMMEFWRIQIDQAHGAGEVTDKHRGALAAVDDEAVG